METWLKHFLAQFFQGVENVRVGMEFQRSCARSKEVRKSVELKRLELTFSCSNKSVSNYYFSLGGKRGSRDAASSERAQDIETRGGKKITREKYTHCCRRIVRREELATIVICLYCIV